MTKLIALAVIAAGVIAADSAEVPAGTTFEIAPEAAEPLLTQGLVKLADEPLAPLPKAKSVKLADEPLAPLPKAKSVKARVLVACPHGQPDDVVSLPADVAKLAEDAGQVDTNKAAVAYAMTLEQNQA